MDRVFTEGDYCDPDIVDAWKHMVHKMRLRQKGRLFGMFAEDIVVDLGTQNVAVVMIGFQNRFIQLNQKTTPKAVEVAKTCMLKGVPLFLVQHCDEEINGTPSPLARIFARSSRLPFVFSIKKGSRDYEIIPELHEACGYLGGLHSDFFLDKKGASALVGTELMERLAHFSIGTVIVCGSLTNVCVSSTARGLANHGFNVFVIPDCSSTCDEGMHQHSLDSLIEWGLARVIPSTEILKSLKAIPADNDQRHELNTGLKVRGRLRTASSGPEERESREVGLGETTPSASVTDSLSRPGTAPNQDPVLPAVQFQVEVST